MLDSDFGEDDNFDDDDDDDDNVYDCHENQMNAVIRNDKVKFT